MKIQSLNAMGTVTTLILNVTAMFIVFGIIQFTDIYRRRGRLDDKLYYAMVILTIVLNITDSGCHIFDGHPGKVSFVINVICNYVFFLALQLFCGIMAWYMVVRARKMQIKRNTGLLIMLPAFLSSVIIACNELLGRFFMDVDPDRNAFLFTKGYGYMYAVPILYIVISFVMILIIDYRVSWLLIMLLALRFFFGVFLSKKEGEGVCCNMICITLGLVFTHIHMLGHPFFEEELR